MAAVRWSGIRLAGVWAVAPSAKGTVEDLAGRFGGADARKIADSTGVEERRLAPDGVCASDLCQEAGSRLLRELAWAPDSVDALVFVSQTADYALPATACGLQQRLGLAPSCAAFDVSLGCSGYVYGLWLAGALLQSRAARRVLLLAGDTMTRLVSPFDRATAPLFGDAGTATAIEGLPGGGPSWTFVLGTDGAGQAHLIVPAGRFRQASSEATRNRTEREGGNRRSDEDLFMDGAEVFAFTLREVPPLVASVLEQSGKTAADIDYVVFHQANQFMLRFLAKKIALPKEKVVLGLKQFGNTTCASIPLAMATELDARLMSGPATLLLAGFGVGWSWAAAVVECGPLSSIGYTVMES